MIDLVACALALLVLWAYYHFCAWLDAHPTKVSPWLFLCASIVAMAIIGALTMLVVGGRS